MSLPVDQLVGLGGIITLLVGLFWLLVRGRIHTAREFDLMVTLKDEQIKLLTDASTRKDDQIEKLMIVGQTVTRVLETVEDLAKQVERR